MNVEKKKVEERTEKQIIEQTKEKSGILPKRAASTTTHLRRKKANYGLAMDVNMEPAVEEQKEGMTMEDHLE
eukprot:15194190-Ditylum_brightwellii.AAC.1